MKFEVVDRKEVKDGFIRKKPKFLCSVKLDFDDDEMATLTEMCKSESYALYDVGEVDTNVDINGGWEYKLGGIQKSAAKNAGIYEIGIRMNTAEAREVTVNELKVVAKAVKDRIDIYRQVQAVGSSDTVEEL